PNNATAIQTKVSVFVCPSTPNPDRVAYTFTHNGFTITNAAVADYSVCRFITTSLSGTYPTLLDPLTIASASDTINGSGVSAHSFRPGGINLGRCDGSVRVLRESVSMRVFASLVTAKAGEVFTLD